MSSKLVFKAPTLGERHGSVELRSSYRKRLDEEFEDDTEHSVVEPSPVLGDSSGVRSGVR